MGTILAKLQNAEGMFEHLIVVDVDVLVPVIIALTNIVVSIA